METAGLAIGATALAGLFNNTIQCFEYIQLGRGFGKDFQTCQLKLDNAGLRLSRWGISLGLSKNVEDVALEKQVGSEALGQAKALLRQINELFEAAQSFSDKFKGRIKPDDSRLMTFNPESELDAANGDLHRKMSQLTIERRSPTSLLQKTKWALYEEKNCRRLVEDIKGLTEELVELFPASQELQMKLCETEVSAIGSNQNLPILRNIAAEQDAILENAIAKVMDRQGANYNVVFSGSHNAGLQMAHNSGSISGNTFGKRT